MHIKKRDLSLLRLVKRCPRCGVVKSMDHYQRCASNSDGLQDRCRVCQNAIIAERDSTKEGKLAVRARSRNYARRNRAAVQARRDYYVALNGEDFSRKNQREAPEKKRARDKVYHALKTGKLCKPAYCESCGKDCTPQAHHNDYTKPLEVLWYCTTCHANHHIEERRL